MSGIVILAIIITVIWLGYSIIKGLSPETMRMQAAQAAQVVCPHCHIKGYVATEPVKIKKGISGAKATGAILTGGVSLLGTGLSRKEDATKAHCSNCGSTWHF